MKCDSHGAAGVSCCPAKCHLPIPSSPTVVQNKKHLSLGDCKTQQTCPTVWKTEQKWDTWSELLCILTFYLKRWWGEHIRYYNEVISTVRVVEASKKELAQFKKPKPNTLFQIWQPVSGCTVHNWLFLSADWHIYTLVVPAHSDTPETWNRLNLSLIIPS